MSTVIVNRNIVILPSQNVRDKAIAMSEGIRLLVPVKFTLDTGTHRPHMTGHQFAIPERNLDLLDYEVGMIAKATQPFDVTMKGFSLFGGSGVFWDCDRDPVLRALHENMVRGIEEPREGYIMDQHADFLTGAKGADIGKERRQSLGRWGNPLAMETFWPHITLTACEKEADAHYVLNSLQPVPMTIRVEALYLTTVGPNGTCPEILKEFRLGK